MTVLGCVCTTLVLFFSQSLPASCLPQSSTQSYPINGTTYLGNKNPFENGPGPQISITTGALEPPQYWVSGFELNRGPIQVFSNSTDDPTYVIAPDPHSYRGFLIKDHNNNTLIAAKDRERGHCGYSYTYYTTANISYHIDPRAGLTDRWYMNLYEGGKNITQLTYYRASNSNKGTVKFTGNHSFAAYFDLQKKIVGNAKEPSNIVMLTIDPSVNLETAYFIGLWNIVKKRMHRCDS